MFILNFTLLLSVFRHECLCWSVYICGYVFKNLIKVVVLLFVFLISILYEK